MFSRKSSSYMKPIFADGDKLSNENYKTIFNSKINVFLKIRNEVEKQILKLERLKKNINDNLDDKEKLIILNEKYAKEEKQFKNKLKNEYTLQIQNATIILHNLFEQLALKYVTDILNDSDIDHYDFACMKMEENLKINYEAMKYLRQEKNKYSHSLLPEKVVMRFLIVPKNSREQDIQKKMLERKEEIKYLVEDLTENFNIIYRSLTISLENNYENVYDL